MKKIKYILFFFTFLYLSLVAEEFTIVDFSFKTNFSKVVDFLTIDSSFYVATKGGLFILTKESKEYYIKQIDNKFLIDLTVLLNDGDSILWIGTNKHELFSYNLKNKTWSYSYGLDFFKINSIYRYNNDILFIGTDKGLSIYSISKRTIIDNVYRNFGDIQDTVLSLFIDNDTIYIKNPTTLSKAYLNDYLGDPSVWINFYDSTIDSRFYIPKDTLSYDIYKKIDIRTWYNRVDVAYYDYITSKLFILGNIHDDTLDNYNLAYFSNNKFRIVDLFTFKNKEEFYDLKRIDKYLIASGFNNTIRFYNTEDNTSFSLDIDRYPSLYTNNIFVIDEKNFLTSHWAYYKDDSTRQIYFQGGFSITNIDTFATYIYSGDSLYYNVLGIIPKFKYYKVNGLPIYNREFYHPVIYYKGVVYAVVNNKEFFAYNTNGTFSNPNDDSLIFTLPISLDDRILGLNLYNDKIILYTHNSIFLYKILTDFKLSLEKKDVIGNINDLKLYRNLGLIATDSGLYIYNFTNLDFKRVNYTLPENKILKLAIDTIEKKLYLLGKNSLSILDFYFYNSPSEIIAEDKPILVYPNPVILGQTHLLYIDNIIDDASTIYIISSDGRIIKEFFPKNTSRIIWDFKDKNGSLISSGVYYIIIDDPRGRFKKKILVINK